MNANLQNSNNDFPWQEFASAKVAGGGGDFFYIKEFLVNITWNLLQTKTVALSSRLQKGSTWFSLFYKVHEVLNYNVTFIDSCLQLRHFKDTLSSFPR